MDFPGSPEMDAPARSGFGDVASPVDVAVAPKPRWRTTNPSPWSRYAARMIDTLLHSFVSLVVSGALLGALLPGDVAAGMFESQILDNQVYATILALVVAIPITAILIGTIGTTTGKWLMGIHVATPEGLPLGIGAALKRELRVLLYGWGGGVPFVSMVALVIAYRRLKQQGTTKWDDPDETVVRYLNHRFATRARVAGGLVFALLLSAGLAALDRM